MLLVHAPRPSVDDRIDSPPSRQRRRGVTPRPAWRQTAAAMAPGCKHFRIIYTRPAWGGRLVRQRECRHCGKRMTTWERAGA